MYNIALVLLITFIQLFEDKQNNMTETNDIEKNKLLGHFITERQPELVKIPNKYTIGIGLYLNREAFEGFKKMHYAAKADGLNLRIISATRNFSRQKKIWENKWTGKRLVDGKNLAIYIPDEKLRAIEILRFSAMPGTSRHHWGTDIDINSVDPEYFNSTQGKKELDWLQKNAHLFGFAQPYKEMNISRFSGYEDEPWHWSYLPLACKYYKSYIATIQNYDITGFLGSDLASELDIINNYVKSISEECKCLD